MLKKTIKYTDFNGVEREDDAYFNLSKSELVKMELSIVGGMTEMLDKLIKTQDGKGIIETVENIILSAYGVKSSDGRGFIKIDKDGHRLADDFKQTEAYNQLFLELVMDSTKFAEFVNLIIPNVDEKQVNQDNPA